MVEKSILLHTRFMHFVRDRALLVPVIAENTAADLCKYYPLAFVALV